MSNRTDWHELIGEIFKAHAGVLAHEATLGPLRDRLEAELHNAFVAGQEQDCREGRSDRLPPHKRKHVTLYRAWFWRLKNLEAIEHKTLENKHEILEALHELDKLWAAMPLPQRRDIDPLIEVTSSGKPWEPLRTLRCPNCGWLHYVSGSGVPTRCSACWCDVAVSIPTTVVSE